MHDQASGLQQWPHRAAVGHIMLLIEHAASLRGHAGYIFFSPRGAEGVLMENSKTSLALRGFSSAGFRVCFQGARPWSVTRAYTRKVHHSRPVEVIDIFSSSRPTTLVHQLVSSMRTEAVICPIIIPVPCSARWPGVMQQWDINS